MRKPSRFGTIAMLIVMTAQTLLLASGWECRAASAAPAHVPVQAVPDGHAAHGGHDAAPTEAPSTHHRAGCEMTTACVAWSLEPQRVAVFSSGVVVAALPPEHVVAPLSVARAIEPPPPRA